MIGGGALSSLWCQIHADILDCRVIQAKDPRLANIRGAVWIAAVALGYLKPHEIRQLRDVSAVFEPDSRSGGGHEQRFREFKNIYHSNRKIYRRLNEGTRGGPP